ncbi:MAG: hypothetical protein ACTMUB_09905 [cyanobacterium endosymbiont of Rhopalodia musculus]|nr:hypothetical protein [cyanobacterium endosymbiont of Epithemia clementina EcSB]WGT68347.1 hypothetical protein P3F56_04690 [cyanobacterium endosymbiont of Epithemia clementina EcSB]
MLIVSGVFLVITRHCAKASTEKYITLIGVLATSGSLAVFTFER